MRDINRLRIITYATDTEHPGLNRFLKPSCDHYGLDLTVLSPDKITCSKPWRHRQKDRMLSRFLDTVADDQLILSTDAYDAWFLCGEDEILDKYYTLNSPLVFSAERNCWPHDSYLGKHYPESTTPHRYLNGGGFIGTAASIRAALKWNKWSLARFRHKRSNQYLWSRQYLQRQEFIKVDNHCQIFHCAGITGKEYLSSPHGTEWRQYLHEPETRQYIINCILKLIQIDGSRIYYKLTGTSPCHLHFNGSVSATMDMPVWDPLKPWTRKH